MKSPGSGLAPSAWAELERIYEVFNRLQTVSRSVKRLYVGIFLYILYVALILTGMQPKLEKLYSAAQTSYKTFTSSQGQPVSHGPHDVADVDAQVDEMEFKYITGHTRLIETSQSQHIGRSQQQKAPTPPHQAPPSQPQRVQVQTIQLEPIVSQPVQAQPPQVPQHHRPIVQQAFQQPLVPPLPPLAQQQQQINIDQAPVSASIGWGQPSTGYEPPNLVAPAAAYQQQQQAPPSAMPVQYQHQPLDPANYGVQSVPMQHQPQQGALPMYDPAYDAFFPPLPTFDSVPQPQVGFQQQQQQQQQYTAAQPGQGYHSGTWDAMQYMGTADPPYGVDGTQQGQQGHNLNAMWQQFMDGIGMYDGMGIDPQQGTNSAR